MRKHYFHYTFFLLLVILHSSCVTTHKINYLQKPVNFIPSYKKDSISYSEYRLKAGDKLMLQVYSLDEKTNMLFNGQNQQMGTSGSSAEGDGNDLYTYTIKDNGKIELPIVGEVLVAGKTIRESKAILETAIQPIVKQGSVDVRMTGRYFNIIGSGKSGKFAIPKEKINIFQALALAGDLGYYTDRTKIRVLRETPNGVVENSFDIRSVDIINSKFYYIEPNDIIFLQPMKEQFWGVTTVWSAISTIMTTYAFAVIIKKTL